MGGVVGDFQEVPSGVPQGSVLDPLLFLMHIDHVAVSVVWKWKAFADDLKLHLFPMGCTSILLGCVFFVTLSH